MRRRLGSLLYIALLLVIAACLAVLSTRFAFETDWSAGARASISPQSRAILAQLKGPLDVVSYARPAGNLREQISTFLARYRRFKPDLQLSFVDPDLDPGALRKAGIETDGEIVLHWKGREQRVLQLDEQHFSDALARLTRSREQLVAFVTGDGERNANGQANADLGDFVTQLASRGVRALPLNLAQAAQVPGNADLVVLASPQAALAPGAVHALVDWVAGGGNLLWLTEPGDDDLNLAPLAQALGIKRLPGVLVDGQGAAFGLGDPRMVVTTLYPPQAITRGFSTNVLFPQAVALAATAGAPWKAEPLLESSAQSWNQIAPVDAQQASTIRYDAASGELRGPLDFGYALSRLSPSPDKGEQRVVVIGDGDFISNTYLANGGNLAFGERLFDWLLGDDALAAVPQRGAPDRVLKPTTAELEGVTFGYLIGLPLVLILAGITITWRRRRR
jgi:gliding motility-associatede transport system auxiliary component